MFVKTKQNLLQAILPKIQSLKGVQAQDIFLRFVVDKLQSA